MLNKKSGHETRCANAQKSRVPKLSTSLCAWVQRSLQQSKRPTKRPPSEITNPPISQHHLLILSVLISILRAILPVLWVVSHKSGFLRFWRNESSSSTDKSALLDGIDSERLFNTAFSSFIWCDGFHQRIMRKLTETHTFLIRSRFDSFKLTRSEPH